MASTLSRSSTSGTQFLDPAVLGRIGNLQLLAKTVVDGFLTGLHRSPYLGFSIEFAEHRPYMPGDDIRRIDWRLFARTDRHYIKLFEADTNANFAVLLDVSASMNYGSHTLTKLDYARYLAACLTYFSSQQRDRVGLVTFDHEIVDYVPPSMKHLDTVLHKLDVADAGRPGALGPPLLKITELLKRKGILVIISDLYEDPEAVLTAIGPIRAKGHDVIVFHLMDPAEIEFPFEEASGFEDLETHEQIPVIPAKLRDEYKAVIAKHLETLKTRLTANRIDYTLLDTSKPLDLALFQYLLARERMSKAR
ncbi:MAG: DUF58 domain-containing protein [Gemmatimonadota bacterium]|nr:DUF58 domain-containing protein [Gemmatimonadota bacterium]MDH3422652.1 DUF58 domain-containing protein [Gemmatimonadota bacterium]